MNQATRTRLSLASLAFLILNVMHTLDHVRQERPLPAELDVVGAVSLTASVVVLLLAVRDHPLAPLGCAALGAAGFVGLLVVHLVPHWSVFSDPYFDANVDALAYGILGLLMAAALYLGYAGVSAVREVSASD
ncbi:MAG: hypothetical protein LC722_04340 [Actinobacteria bacterium]|nr:hypothetical protein [Actinomycetota bacterium]